MSPEKKSTPKEKRILHERNRNRDRYDLQALVATCPELKSFVIPNKFNEDSIDFAHPDAVKMLNKAILHHYYHIEHWDIPDGYLCPPIPGRADYLHYMADVLKESNYGRMPKGEKITCLDVGVGANGIYPIIGVQEYNWSFIGSDIDPVALASAEKIVTSNPSLKGNVEFRLQQKPSDIFYGVIRKDELIDLSICNPPFHASAKEAKAGTSRKVKNLSGKKAADPVLNFAGKNNELWCDGGEHKFVNTMIKESKNFAKNCFWFSSLVSKQSNLKGIYKALESHHAVKVETIPMGTGNKSSRVVTWTFLSRQEQKNLRETRWR